MFVTISRSGPKEQVIKGLREPPFNSELEEAVCSAIADHVEQAATDDSVGVTASISVTYLNKEG